MAALLLVGPQVRAARPSQAELSESALKGAVGPISSAALDERVRAARERLRRRETERPAEVGYATVVFRKGSSETDLDRFAQLHGVEVARAEAKIAVDDAGTVFTVFTVSIGSRDILLRDGTFAERLKKAMGHQRVEFHDTAQNSTDEQERQRFMSAAQALPILYYKIECLGQNRSLAEIGRDENVAAIFVRDGNADVISYNAFKEMYASWRRDTPPTIRVKGHLERPPGDPRIDPNAPVRTSP
jgi:hypothetical protein